MNNSRQVKSFLTLFPGLKPVFLHKDVGAIPFYLADKCGWCTSLAFFEQKDCSLEQLSDGVYEQSVVLISLGQWKGKLLNSLRTLRFLLTRSKEFDVVNYYHDSVKNMLYSLMYKLCNPEGKVYCKLDMSHLELELLAGNCQKFVPSLVRKLKYLLSKWVVDYYSVETKVMCRSLSENYYFRGRIQYIPNGIDCPEGIDIGQLVSAKEKIILTVGSLGATAKNNELLVDAVALLNPALVAGWKVYLVGPLVNPDFYENGFRENDHFRNYVSKVVAQHAHLTDTFIFTGNVSDRFRLFDIYSRAQIFCLTSRYESFGFVVPEAMFFGNYVIASDLPPLRDLTDNGRCGALFPSGSACKLAELLTDALKGKVDLVEQGKASHEFIRENFNWRNIVREIDHLLS